MKRCIKFTAVFCLLLLIIPAIVFFKKPSDTDARQTADIEIPQWETVRILFEERGEISELSLEEYLTGCVMAQIPCTFEKEAVKAQAIICRTYIFYKKLFPDEDLNGADVSDSGEYQSYFNKEQAEEFYGEGYSEAFEKASAAVKETDGVYLSYNGQPAVTAFHPVSSGYTESALDIWGTDIPYLKSVSSQSDKLVEGCEQNVEFTKDELFARITSALEIETDGQVPDGEWLYISEQTKNGTALTVTVCVNGEKKQAEASGIALILGLNSSNFSFSFDENSCVVTCRGCGHLVGLSQWGANSMAKEGKNHREILRWYFSGISFSQQQ